jgi:hypothetical protein
MEALYLSEFKGFEAQLFQQSQPIVLAFAFAALRLYQG